MADRFTFAMGEGAALSEIAQLDTMVTVVDCANFLSDLEFSQDLKSLGQADQELALGPGAWSALADPFPKWNRTVADLLGSLES